MPVSRLWSTAWATAQAYAYYYGAPNYYNYYDPSLTNPNQAYPLPSSDIGYSEELDRQVTQTAVFGELGYDIVIYPVTLQRVAMKACEDALEVLKREGTQESLLDKMQTRSALYDLLEYDGVVRTRHQP